MAYGKKPMSENEKKAKLTALRGANSMAKEAMKSGYSKYKDSKELKSHVKDISKESGIDFKNDSDNIVDPGMDGDVVGRHVSDENIDHCETESVYDINEIDAQLKHLLEQKSKFKGR